MAERTGKEQRDHVWLRLQIPVDLHSKIQALKEENKSTIAGQVLELLERSLQESALIESVIGYFDNDAQDFQIEKRVSMVSIAWNSNGERKRIIYDSSTQEIFEKLKTEDPK